MEAERPVMRTWFLFKGVVSLLLAMVLVVPHFIRFRADRTLGERWGFVETGLARAFGMIERAGNCIQPSELGDYTYLYNQSEVSSLDKIWQRQRFSMSLGWTLS